MPEIRIVICRNAQDANVMFHVLQGDGFQCLPPSPIMDFVYIDPTQAFPPDPEMLFKNHIVLVGRKP
ncbi:MAG: hypothetical protein K0S81_3825 [Rhodospirillales bacterium]|jgi:hypothetical protein|nr:hypothetical protein [Rhodospirillales bacterium]